MKNKLMMALHSTGFVATLAVLALAGYAVFWSDFTACEATSISDLPTGAIAVALLTFVGAAACVVHLFDHACSLAKLVRERD